MPAVLGSGTTQQVTTSVKTKAIKVKKKQIIRIRAIVAIVAAAIWFLACHS